MLVIWPIKIQTAGKHKKQRPEEQEIRQGQIWFSDLLLWARHRSVPERILSLRLHIGRFINARIRYFDPILSITRKQDTLHIKFNPDGLTGLYLKFRFWLAYLIISLRDSWGLIGGNYEQRN